MSEERQGEAHPRRRGVRPPARKERSSEGKVRFMTGYDFHPEAEADLNEIWGYIAADSDPDPRP